MTIWGPRIVWIGVWVLSCLYDLHNILINPFYVIISLLKADLAVQIVVVVNKSLFVAPATSYLTVREEVLRIRLWITVGDDDPSLTLGQTFSVPDIRERSLPSCGARLHQPWIKC